MKVVFLSNFFNHHQQFFSEAMYGVLGNDYTFIETAEMPEERKQLGYGIEKLPVYVKHMYNNADEYPQYIELINTADVVISGSAPEQLLKERKKQNKLIIRYQERMFKSELSIKQKLKRTIAFFICNFRKKGIYLLCASGFSAADYKKIGLFKNKAYKWGYFPKFNEYNCGELLAKKAKNKLLWCGRFLSWKHPEYALQVAERLKNDGYDFSVDFIGMGPMEEELKRSAKEKGLGECVSFLGSMKPDAVRENMDKASIFMFTSNFEEGWGAVLNEAMNSGCAVVASHAIGAVPYLLTNNENGLVFENENVDDLYNKIKFLMDNPQEQKRLGENAYKTIEKTWNPNIAAERFLKLVQALQKGENQELFLDGPCSKAEIISNNWFGE